MIPPSINNYSGSSYSSNCLAKFKSLLNTMRGRLGIHTLIENDWIGHTNFFCNATPGLQPERILVAICRVHPSR